MGAGVFEEIFGHVGKNTLITKPQPVVAGIRAQRSRNEGSTATTGRGFFGGS
jgi:hypothetical protein